MLRRPRAMKTSETGRSQDQIAMVLWFGCGFPPDGVLSVRSRQLFSDLWGAVGVGATEGNTSPLAFFCPMVLTESW